MHFLHDLTMDAIDNKLNMSRSSVSRLLAVARAQGIVDIKVASPTEASQREERETKSRYGVSAYLVPVPELNSPVNLFEKSLSALHECSVTFFPQI